MSTDRALRKKLYNIFDPDICRNDLYVPLDEARGSQSVIDRLADNICLSNSPTYQLLAGHRGSGKSTELLRLKEVLKNGKDKYFVVLFDIVKENNIDPQDIDFSEVLIAIISHLANNIKEAFDDEIGDTYFKRLFNDIGAVLSSEVDFSTVKLNAGFLQLSGALSKNPDLRKTLRGKVAPIANQWITATNLYIDKAIDTVIKDNYAGLVIIVDGLDKLTISLDPKQKSCAESLFVDWGNQLRSLNCHVLYALPLDLAYSLSERDIASSFGIASSPVIPMTKVFDDEGEETLGFTKFVDIVYKRINDAGTTIDKVFDGGQETLKELIRKSGGQPRELMVLFREAMTGGSFPITLEHINNAAREITNAYSRQLFKEHWTQIKFVKENKHFDHTVENDKYCMDLLGIRAVLQYRNGKEWYGLNPLLSENPNDKNEGK